MKKATPGMFLLLLIGLGMNAQAQIGTATVGLSVFGEGGVGRGSGIGKSTLAVCKPSEAACGNVVYVFTGNGFWTNPANWLAESVPPPVLPAGQGIVVNPETGGECILNVPQTISNGATLTILPPKRLRVIKSLLFLK